MTTVAIHQSQYLPWPPFFEKIQFADIFVVMDNVQFQKNGIQNRNKIRNKQSEFWLTIPVTGHLGDTIKNMNIVQNNWQEKHWKSIIISYSKSPFWNTYSGDLKTLYEHQYTNLFEVNNHFFNFLISRLNIKKKIVYLSDLSVEGTKSDLVLSICKVLNGNIYISGPGGKSYLNEESFLRSGISIKYQDSVPPIYEQFHGKFIPGLSILDMMFNVSSHDIQEYLGVINGDKQN